MPNNAIILAQEIIARSTTDQWAEAKLEWELDHIVHCDDGEDSETCLCSHYPIRECCWLRNKINGIMALVGNCCVKKFMGMTAPDLIFRCLARIAGDDSKALNPETIQYGFDHGWFSEWERNWLTDTAHKRELSEAQEKMRTDLNERALQKANYQSQARLKRNEERIQMNLLRIERDPSSIMMSQTAEFLHQHRILTDWEKDFVTDTTRVKEPSAKQLMWRKRINHKAIVAIRPVNA